MLTHKRPVAKENSVRVTGLACNNVLDYFSAPSPASDFLLGPLHSP